jgi:hypothetical protein
MATMTFTADTTWRRARHGDIIDGGAGNDVIVGDNASIQRTGGSVSPRFRVLKERLSMGKRADNDGLPW